MNATPQQVSGGSKYSNKTLLGNWSEELAVGESKLQGFKKRSESGSLALRKQELKIARCMEIVPHTYSEDGLVRFGDTVILRHDQTGTVLSCDPFEDQVARQNKFLVTASLQPSAPARARNVFRLVRPAPALRSPDDDGSDAVLKVGQAFVLECNEALLIQPGSNLLAPTLYLASTKKNERNVTRNTNRQMVYLSPQCDAESVWMAIVPSRGKSNAADRFLSMGTALRTSHPFQLTHRQTNMYLTCDGTQKFTSEFGSELECYADRTALSGKLGLMVSEFKGLSTPATLAKPDSPVYAWHFVCSGDRAAGVDVRVLPAKATLSAVLAELRADIVRGGAYGGDGFWALRARLMMLDKQAGAMGKIDREDLKDALHHWGITLPRPYLDTVIDQVDKSRTGLITASDLVDLVRGPMPAFREVLVEETFFGSLHGLDNGPALDNGLSLADVARCMVPSMHPVVVLGGGTESDALDHIVFLCGLRAGPGVGATVGGSSSVGASAVGAPAVGRGGGRDGAREQRLTLDLFRRYYADLSAGLGLDRDQDGIFEAAVRGGWAV